LTLPTGGTTAVVAARGHVEAMALYAGQSAAAVEDVTPAADVAREMAEGAVRLLRAGS
jgi:enoyl-[acyl-carrier protein] reductase II